MAGVIQESASMRKVFIVKCIIFGQLTPLVRGGEFLAVL